MKKINKKIILIFGISLFLGLFVASSHLLDFWQNKSALEAAGGFPCTEGFVSPIVTPCVTSCYPAGSCCVGNGICSMAIPPACLEQNLTGASAGGQSCGANYLLSVQQVPFAQGAQNLILGGTTMATLTVVATEKGCIGCSALINNSKV